MKPTPLTLAVLSLASSASSAGRNALPLSELQNIQHTLLDDELAQLADGGARQRERDGSNALPYQSWRCDGDDGVASKTTYSYLRGRALGIDGASYSPEQIYENIVEQAWDNADAMGHPSPFLVCTNDEDSVKENVVWVSAPTREDTCHVVSITSMEARRIMEQATSVQPLADLTKIDAGAVERALSSEWRIPFEGKTIDNAQQHTPTAVPKATNETNGVEVDNDWERTIKVHFSPSIWIENDADLADDIHALMSDIQRWAGFGWAMRHERIYNEEERRNYAAKSLSDKFALTSATCRSMLTRNHRVAFWDNAIRLGLEADHACSEMFSHMKIQSSENAVGGRYRGAELIMNPKEGSRPREYDSSASNPACVLSLMAGLAVHPRVLSISVNAPIGS